MHDTSPPDDVFECPACRSAPLEARGAGWVCTGCATNFPLLDGVPVLFAEPALALGEWRLRLQRLHAELLREARERRDAVERTASPLTRSRLKLEAAARADHARRLAALLAPLDLEAAGPALETHRALGTQLPETQGLASYYVNAHRDWVWGAAENEASCAVVDAALGDAHGGRLLVLGAGAGRLAYDLHQRRRPALTIALDINPLFGVLARRLFAGERVELYEFPIAPRDLESHAILRTLAADAPARDGLHVVLGDASRAPFRAGAFDAVVTPWLIDVLDERLDSFAPRLNRLLRPGGRWVSTGSLAFAHADPAQQLSLEEVLERIAGAGFTPPQVNAARVPYLCSPASRHGRVEEVVTLAATKRDEAVVAPPPTLPEWLVRSDVPVPALPAFQEAALTMRIYGFVASLVDGRRSLADMVDVLVHERLLTADTAQAALRAFLRRLYEDASRRTQF